jgi:uncharacterized lipoprotein YddW (UPF0748 family)
MLATVLLLLLTGLPTQVVYGAAEDLLPLAYEHTDEAREAWTPGEKSPQVKARPKPSRGIILPCPFGGIGFGPFRFSPDRLFWDHNLERDLSRYTSFELDLSCNLPSAVRSLSVYFKSGDGWYAWHGPLEKAHRHTLHLLKSEFTTEGNPGGWQHIEKVRISPWQGREHDAVLTLYALKGHVDSILLVQGTRSAPDAGERNAAKRTAHRISTWLKEMGIPHGLLMDEEVTAGRLRQARVVILCYNPNPTPTELRALQHYLQAQGQLIVFYSASEELAQMMGMKLGSYTAAEEPLEWTHMAFEDPSGQRVPPRVLQQSWNIRPVYPANRKAHVLAYWAGAGGKTEYPAWVASPRGLWMTHILLDDDPAGKKAMLLGLLGRYEPAVWPRAAWTALQEAGRIDSFRGIQDAVARIEQQADRAGTRREVDSYLAQAREAYRAMLDKYERFDFPAVVQGADRLDTTLSKAYALAQEPKRGEVRGVWDSIGTGWYPGDWPRSVKQLDEHGLNTIFVYAANAGSANYPSRFLAPARNATRYGDLLKTACEAAQARKLRIHAWKICWDTHGAPAAQIAAWRRAGRLQQTASGRTLNWLCPTQPANRQHELAVLRELARYPVHGIHLDYIRYPTTGCYCPACRAAFEAWHGERVNWPDEVQSGGQLRTAFVEWRAEQITAFVTQVRRMLNDEHADLHLSAAVFPRYPECVEAVGQDWRAWLSDNLVDSVCPMNYTRDASTFENWVRSQEDIAPRGSRIYAGIGVTANESKLAPDKVIEQIRILRRHGAEGFVLFKMDTNVRDRVLPLLSDGVTRR